MHRLGTIFLALFMLIAPCAQAENNPPLTGEMARLKLYDNPETLPEISLDAGGSSVFLSNYSGKLIVLNLWATWCPPCLNELPSLNALQTAIGTDKVQVLAVSIDTTGIDPVKKYLTDHQLTALMAVIDKEQRIQKFNVMRDIQGIPVTLIIDPQSRVLARFEGEADWNGRDFRAVLDYYLKTQSFMPFVIKTL